MTSQRYTWTHRLDEVDLEELSRLYLLAPLGNKPPEALATVYRNSRYLCFVHAGDALVGAGRALADGVDCAYIADVAVHPEHQGRGLGSDIIRNLVDLANGHKKIILYAAPGTEDFYRGLGFLHMNTAMAIWADPRRAVAVGLLRPAE
ncbi:GNAT family N-acetyltransferase [Streptomyces tendae]|uniref:GNAT family N-acetyltransferase n=1 Tax=Streptomyces tendae TaxID=1932 RepID=UPI0033BF3F98